MGNFGSDFDSEKTKDDVTAHLVQRFPEHDSTELHQVASETVDELVEGATVTGFIDTVAEHEAAERLKKGDAAG